MVKPMPASTCWQCLAADARAATGDGLGHRRGDGRGVEPGGVEHRDRGLDRDQRLGQAVPDGLELGDRLVELDAFERVLVRHRQRPARHADQLVRERELRELRPRRPSRRGSASVDASVAVHLDQSEVGVDAVRPARVSSASTRRRSSPTTRYDARAPSVARPCTVAVPSPARRCDRSRAAPPRCRRRAHDRARTRRRGRAPTTCARFALELEQRRHRGARVERQRVVPAELGDARRRARRRCAARWRRAGCARTARGRRLRARLVIGRSRGRGAGGR